MLNVTNEKCFKLTNARQNTKLYLSGIMPSKSIGINKTNETEKGEGVRPLMENSIILLFFFSETFP